MNPRHGTSLETRPSLLDRLRSNDDPLSWNDFYKTYGGLIRSFAEKAGFTPDEVEEVLQETAIGVARRLPQFVYDPKVCRFKTWLLNLTRWRIQDQFRRRRRIGSPSPDGGLAARQRNFPSASDGSDETSALERVPDPALPEFGAEWDAAWEKALLTQALERVRARIDERQFQVFDLYVTKAWPPAQVAQTLGIGIARVYLTKHRVSALLEKEVRRLEKMMQKRLVAESP